MSQNLSFKDFREDRLGIRYFGVNSREYLQKWWYVSVFVEGEERVSDGLVKHQHRLGYVFKQWAKPLRAKPFLFR